MEYGILSALPTLTVLITALITKKVLEPLFIGTVIGFIIAAGTGFFGAFVDATFTVMFEDTWVWILLVTLLFGGQIALLEASGGSLQFTHLANKIVKGKKSSLLATWILGIAIFIDDYLNALAVGAAMRKVTDEHKVPREMLAYIVDATAGPMAILTPFSAWAVFFMGMIADNGVTEWLGLDSFPIYVRSIPFMIYGFVAIIIIPLVITRIIPPLGAMKKAWQRVDTTGKVFPETYDVEALQSDEAVVAKKSKLRYFLIPLLFLIGGTILMGNDLIKGVLISLAVTFIMLTIEKAMAWKDIIRHFIKGMEGMVELMTLMMLAFLLLEANKQLGFAEYVINAVLPWMKGAFLPALSFTIVGALAFATGSLWGIAAIAMPIIFPLAHAIDVNMYLTIGAVVSGAVFGSHCCFYTDATLLASRSCQLKPIDHALSQIPYGIIGAAVSIVIYLILGFTL